MGTRFAAAGCALLLASAATADDHQSVIYVDPAELPQYWHAVSEPTPDYPPEALERNREGCVTVSFIIENDGHTSNFAPLVTYPVDLFTSQAIAAIKSYRFVANEKNADGQPVFTFKTFTFALAIDDNEQDARHANLNVACTDAALTKITELLGAN